VSAVIPTRVIGGRYVVLAELGRGGMGVVWRAEDRVMGRYVAVKELHLPSGLGEQERRLFRERLLREARTAGRLNHPGIVTVYDVIADGGVDHIVMELIEARTLADVVAASGPLDERTGVSVTQQLLDALGAAHDSGVVHRDVKPSNVMVGAKGRVKLTDFGIAQAAEDPRLTTTGSLVGSPGYMAPERLEGQPAAPASDLWSLGATMYYAVQGVGPFSRDSTAATISAVLHGEVVTTRTRGPLSAVIGGLLQRDPRARLAGPQAAALLAGSGGPPSVSDEDTQPVRRLGSDVLPGPAGAPARPRWRWLGAAAAALVVGLVVGVVGGYSLAEAGQPDAVTLTYGDGGQVPEFSASSSYPCLIAAPAAGRAISSSSSVSCDEPHDAEMFFRADLYSSSTVVEYPGVAQLSEVGAATCRFYFDSDLIVGADKNALTIVALVPAEATFLHDSSTVTGSPSFSERYVYCVLRATDGRQLEGSRIKEQPS
jgi:eukaryotic-like serine/threonine-protein kinase